MIPTLFRIMVSSLKLKSAAHEKEVAKLLSSTELQPTNFIVPTSELTQPALTPVNAQTDVPPAPYLPVPDYYEVKELKDTPDPQVPGVQNQNPADRVIADSEVGLDLNNTDSPSSDDAEPASTKLFLSDMTDTILVHCSVLLFLMIVRSGMRVG